MVLLGKAEKPWLSACFLECLCLHLPNLGAPSPPRLSSSLMVTGSRYASSMSHVVFVVDLSSHSSIAIEVDNHKLECQTLHFCFFKTCFLGKLLELLQNTAIRKSGNASAS
jgi:hypothetical protein